MQYGARPYWPTSPQTLHKDKDNAHDAVKYFKDHNVTPCVFLFTDNGRGYSRAETSFTVMGEEFKMVEPAAMVSCMRPTQGSCLVKPVRMLAGTLANTRAHTHTRTHTHTHSH